jgi:hypothetical protein
MLPARTFAARLRIASLNLYYLKPTLKMGGEAVRRDRGGLWSRLSVCLDRSCAVAIPGVARIHVVLFPASRYAARHCSHGHRVQHVLVSYDTTFLWRAYSIGLSGIRQSARKNHLGGENDVIGVQGPCSIGSQGPSVPRPLRGACLHCGWCGEG